MAKEVVVHIHNRILLSHKKEHIYVSSDEVDEPRTYYTEWSESEREREIPYSNTYIRDLEKWYWRIYLQGNSGETDTEKMVGKRLALLIESWKEKSVLEKHSNVETYITICKIDSQRDFAVWLRKLKTGSVSI